MAEEEFARRLTTIIAMDLAGYSRMMGADEAGTLSRLKQCRALIDPINETHGGRLVGTAGDGLLLEFSSVVDAVTSAVEVQKSLAEYNHDISSEEKMLFRIGINLGDVLEDGDDIFGDGVNVAARIEALAQPGSISLSRSVYESVRDRMDIGLEDMGETAVKNIARPVQVFRVLGEGEKPSKRMLFLGANGSSKSVRRLVGALVVLVAVVLGAWQLGFIPPGDATAENLFAKNDPLLVLPSGPSIAVLSFRNLTNSPDQEYFADGLMEEIIIGLTRFQDLFIFGQNTTLKYKGKPTDAKTIGTEIGAQYVLNGSVRVVSDKIRISTRLTETKTGSNVWAETYERAFTTSNIFEIQDEITQKIVGTIGGSQGAITRIASKSLQKRGTEDLTAYECLLRARRYHIRHNPKQHLIARDCLERAIKIDPNFVEAHGELAYVLLEEYRHGWNVLPNSLERSVKMAGRALELDPDNQITHWALAMAYLSQGKHELFEAETQRAVTLNPNNSAVVGYLGFFMAPTGRWEDGLGLLSKAMKLNPGHPSWYHVAYFLDHYRKGEYKAAMERLQLAGLKHVYYVQSLLAAGYAEMDQMDKAKEAMKRLTEIKKGFSLTDARFEYAVKRRFEPELVEKLIDGLRKAGLK